MRVVSELDSEVFSVGERLNALLEAAGRQPLSGSDLDCFQGYLGLLRRWNARMNLTAVRDPEQIMRRHFLESILCAQALPLGLRTLLDFGSGAGFPGLPIAICRRDLAVTLAESQTKKSAFLREALRSLGVAGSVHSGRAETLGRQFDCVTLRAVDKMEQAVRAASQLVCASGWLAVMTTKSEGEKVERAAGCGFVWSPDTDLPGSEQRVLMLGHLTAAYLER